MKFDRRIQTRKDGSQTITIPVVVTRNMPELLSGRCDLIYDENENIIIIRPKEAQPFEGNLA